MHDLTHFKEEVRRRLPLSRVVGARVRLQQQSGQAYKGLCPFHTEKTPSFHVYDDNNNYHCFGCGAHGDAIDFLERTENLSFLEALSKMAHMIGIVMPDFKQEQGDSRTKIDLLYAIYEETTCFFQGQLMGSAGQQAREYLKNRLIPSTSWAEFRLGYAPADKRLIDHLKAKGFELEIILASKILQKDKEGRLYSPFRDRLMFPITDRMGKVIAFGGRILGTGQPKYLNSADTPLFHKSRELYSHHRARKADSSLPLVVAEGYMDVIALHHIGGCRPVATLGTACTPDHIEALWRLSCEPILCFDGDSAGQRASLKALSHILPLLKVGYTASFLELPKNQDPADYWEHQQGKDFQELLKKPTALFDFLWCHYVVKAAAKTPEAQAKVEKDLLEQIRFIQDKTVKNHAYGWAKQELSTYFWKLKTANSKTGGLRRREGTVLSLPKVSPHEKSARIFIAFLINYPQLVLDFEEEIGKFELTSPLLSSLKEVIITFCLTNKNIDNSLLTAYLKERGYETTVSQLLSTASMHMPLSEPGHGYLEVKEAWEKILHQQWSTQRIEDIKVFQENFSKNFTQEGWNKIQYFCQETKNQYRKIFQGES